MPVGAADGDEEGIKFRAARLQVEQLVARRGGGKVGVWLGLGEQKGDTRSIAPAVIVENCANSRQLPTILHPCE